MNFNQRDKNMFANVSGCKERAGISLHFPLLTETFNKIVKHFKPS